MQSIAPGTVEAREILLVTQHPTNALASLIVELDRSPIGFSHAGVADEYGRVVSSYPHYLPDDVFVLPGLRHDPLEHFWDEGQHVHRLALPTDTTHHAPAQRLRGYPEDREGAFGFAKVVIVAAALHALLPENRITPEAEYEVVRRAIDAAWEWRSDDDFYCAEFVAHLYGRPFTLGELRPPPCTEIEDDDVDTDRRGAGLTPAAITVGAVWLSLLASPRQRASLWALKKTIWRYDPAFFEESIEVLFGNEADRHDDPERRTEESRLNDDEDLPPALVTPRMLEQWGRGTALVRSSSAPVAI